MPENTQNDVFLGAFNGFLAGGPCLGCRKVDFRFSSGLVDTSNQFFYTREEPPPDRERVLCPPFFYVQNAPTFGFGQWLLHNRYTHNIIPVALIQDRPLEYFIKNSITAPSPPP
jgi:hypothetical protein